MSGRVIVVGAGVGGLTVAHRLLRADPSLDVAVLEAGEVAGGRLVSTRLGELDVEAGPDSFVARKPWAVDLCRELGLGLVEPAASGTFVWTDRGLVPMPRSALGVPAGVEELARWPGLSRGGRARAMADLVRRGRAPEGDEPLGTLLRRRLGDEAVEVLVAPLLAGLFAGDVDRLGVLATFPELAAWERVHGSLIRGARAAMRAAEEAGPMFVKPAGGVGRLPSALLDAVGPGRVHLRSVVTAVVRDGAGYVVAAGDAGHPAEAVVLATPAPVAADLLGDLATEAAASLASIRHVSTAVVRLVYPLGTADALPQATGFVVPRGKAPMTAATFLSRKWPDPAFGTRAVLRCFVGAAGSEDVLEAPDEDIVGAVCRHLAAALPLPAAAEASAVVRWPRSMPQYEVGHRERVAAAGAALPPGIFLVGNAYGGVGVPDTIRMANEAAERVRRHLAQEPIEREHAS